MNLVNIWTAVRARAIADTGTGGLFNVSTPLVSGIYAHFATPVGPSAYPYIVFDVDGMQQQDGFAVDIINVQVRFHVFALMESATTSGFDRCSAVLERLYGDAIQQAGLVPGYGFHRHALTFASGLYAGSIMHRTGMTQEHNDDHLHFIDSYELLISNAA